MALRIGHTVVDGPAEEVLVLTRVQGDINIIARAVVDMKPFEQLCPEPKPPKKLVKGGFVEDTENPDFIASVMKQSELRFAYICIKSLEPSDIAWNRVDINKPSTWTDWTKELQDAGLSHVEVNRIMVTVMQANSLDENKLRQARDSFVRGMQAPSVDLSSQNTEQPNTQSGTPASDSE